MNRVALRLHRLEERRRTPTLLQVLSSRSASVSLLLHAACMTKSGCMMSRPPLLAAAAHQAAACTILVSGGVSSAGACRVLTEHAHHAGPCRWGPRSCWTAASRCPTWRWTCSSWEQTGSWHQGTRWSDLRAAPSSGAGVLLTVPAAQCSAVQCSAAMLGSLVLYWMILLDPTKCRSRWLADTRLLTSHQGGLQTGGL